MKNPAVLARITGLRLTRERRRAAEALADVRLAERQLAASEQLLARCRQDRARRDAELRAEPRCEQRRFMLAAAARSLSGAEREHEEACRRLARAQEHHALARKAEQKAQVANGLEEERAALLRRRRAEYRAEREGEDRWTPAPTA